MLDIKKIVKWSQKSVYVRLIMVYMTHLLSLIDNLTFRHSKQKSQKGGVWLRWQGKRLRIERSWAQTQAKERKIEKYFILFLVGCFGTQDIHL